MSGYKGAAGPAVKTRRLAGITSAACTILDKKHSPQTRLRCGKEGGASWLPLQRAHGVHAAKRAHPGPAARFARAH